MSEGNIPARVFLSYAHADQEVASRVQKDLLKRGIAVWRDLENLKAGHDWEEQVREAIRICHGVIYLATPDARGSRIVRGELVLAKTYGKPIYPVWAAGLCWPDVASLEDISTQYIDIRGSQYEEGLLQLVAFLKPFDFPIDKQRNVTNLQKDTAMKASVHVDDKKRKSPGMLRTVMNMLRQFFNETRLAQDGHEESRQLTVEARKTVLTQRRNPYKGLKAFTAEEARDFFGREKLIDTMIDEIKQIIMLEQRYANRQEPRFLTVVGPSGSGKSSVVMAGLVPRLQQDIGDTWTFLAPMRPGKEPLEALAQTLLPQLPGSASMRTILDHLNDESMRALHWYASDIARQQGSRVVLVVDQFEELFTETTDEKLRQRFIDLLAVAATEPENKVIVIVTMRADFSDHPMKYQLLHRIMEAHRIAIPPMTIENLRAVIERPASLDDVQVRFEENLVGDLLLDIHGQEENLPLLQFTLEKLFAARHDNFLTLEAYEALGRVQGALSKHADEVYEGLPSDQHRRLAEALFTWLINPGDLEQDATRRRVQRSELKLLDASQHHQMQETIQTFINARLITANEIVTGNPAQKVPVIEISHEALISAWERLGDWVKVARNDMRMRQTLSNDIEQWQERRQPAKLLYNRIRLKDGLIWARCNILTEREAQFLEASKHYQLRRRLKYTIVSISLVIALVLALIPLRDVISSRLFPTVVTNLHDSGPGSLRTVIANASSGSTITFAVQGTIVLGSSLRIVGKELTLDGPATSNPIIITNSQKPSAKSVNNSNNNNDSIYISSDASVTIRHLAFEKSFVRTGSFIENDGTLVLDSCTIDDNISYYNGGGLANLGGSLTITNSHIQNNTSSGQGGGIYSLGGSVTLNHTYVSGNSANIIGGGIYDLGDGNLTLNQSLVMNNLTTNSSPASNGGGIGILNGRLTLNASFVEQNVTSGYGGGVALLGSSGLFNKSVIEGNEAGQYGGGLAVELDSESDQHSIAVIWDMEITDTQQTSYYIGNNITHGNKDSQNVLGKVPGTPENQNRSMIINDDSSQVLGTPPPSNRPEKSKEYLGTLDLDRYCHLHYSQDTSISLDINSSLEMYCTRQSHGQVVRSLINTVDACHWQYPQAPAIMARLTDYYNPSSWQCYKNERLLGKISSYLDGYCRSLSDVHYIGVTNTDGTAYGWECLDQNKSPVELSVGDACQWHYHTKEAFYNLVDFNNPDGWECWTPT